MADKPAAEKTEQPTEKRLKKARQKGQVVQSQELPATISVIVLLAAITATAPSLLKWFSFQMRQGLSCQTDVFVDNNTFMQYLSDSLSGAAFAIAPVMAALIGGSIVARVIVSGLNFAPEPIRLKLDEVDPVTGFG